MLLHNCTQATCPMTDGLTRFILLENARMAAGSPFRQIFSHKGVMAAIGLMWNGKRLTQILEQRARQPEICGFESFREAVVDESKRMPGLIALAVFGEQAGQGHRRPQFPSERRLLACDGECFSQAVHR